MPGGDRPPIKPNQKTEMIQRKMVNVSAIICTSVLEFDKEEIASLSKTIHEAGGLVIPLLLRTLGFSEERRRYIYALSCPEQELQLLAAIARKRDNPCIASEQIDAIILDDLSPETIQAIEKQVLNH